MMSRVARAVVVSKFGGPEVLEITEKKLELGPKDVLVKVHAFGVNPVETYIRSGTHLVKPPLPYTPGSDGAGVIEEIGAEVHKWKPSDRVYIAGSKTGTYGDHCVCSEDNVHHLPAKTSFEQGASLTVPYATAYASLFHHAQAKEGDVVLVHGASGAVGIAAVQWARARNIRVLGTASSAEGLRLIEKYGAEAFNHREEDYQQKIVAATEGRGVDVILEMLANVNLQNDLQVLSAKYGRIVIIGSRGQITIDPRSTMSKNLTVKGMNLFNSTAQEISEIHRELYKGLEDGSLFPVVSEPVYRLEEVSLAHEHVISHPTGSLGKIVVRTF